MCIYRERIVQMGYWSGTHGLLASAAVIWVEADGNFGTGLGTRRSLQRIGISSRVVNTVLSRGWQSLRLGSPGRTDGREEPLEGWHALPAATAVLGILGQANSKAQPELHNIRTKTLHFSSQLPVLWPAPRLLHLHRLSNSLPPGSGTQKEKPESVEGCADQKSFSGTFGPQFAGIGGRMGAATSPAANWILVPCGSLHAERQSIRACRANGEVDYSEDEDVSPTAFLWIAASIDVVLLAVVHVPSGIECFRSCSCVGARSDL
jgi:hypothetical protein